MITLDDIAGLPHGEGKAVAIRLWNERLVRKNQMKHLHCSLNEARHERNVLWSRLKEIRKMAYTGVKNEFQAGCQEHGQGD